jgi:hypothetical protein
MSQESLDQVPEDITTVSYSHAWPDVRQISRRGQVSSEPSDLAPVAVILDRADIHNIVFGPSQGFYVPPVGHHTSSCSYQQH